MREGRAFTVVELLVVVAVMAILASLFFPALNRSREASRQTVCMNNLRQLGIAAQMYWDENEELAWRYRRGVRDNGDVYWFGWLERGAEGARSFDRKAGALYPYLAGKGVEVCPSMKYHFAKFKLKATGAAYGYGYNINLAAPMTREPFKITRLRVPGQTALLADAAQVNTFQPPASEENPMLEEFYYVSANEATTHFRHGGRRCEAVLCDGHVESMGMRKGSRDERMPGQEVGELDEKWLKTE